MATIVIDSEQFDEVYRQRDEARANYDQLVKETRTLIKRIEAERDALREGIRDIGYGIERYAEDVIWVNSTETAIDRVCALLGVETYEEFQRAARAAGMERGDRYLRLLMKYINHVGEVEGIDFITDARAPGELTRTPNGFTDSEWRTLFDLAMEVWNP